MKTKILSLVILFFTSVGLMAQITGTVTDLSTNAPVANHPVTLLGDSTANPPIFMTTTTNASGAYTFANVGSSSYYTVSTMDCHQDNVNQTVNSSNAVVNLQICVGNSCQAIFTSGHDTINHLKIYFSDLSLGNPTTWSWDFGDGSTSNIQNPSHTYASAGSYSVKLSISSANCNDAITKVVVVSVGGVNCASAFNYTISPSNSLTVQFTDISSGSPTSWAWSFGDGNSSTLQNPTHTYTSAGTYNVSLVIAKTNCQSSSNQNIVVPKTVSIDNTQKSLSIKTYPNPVEDQLNIALNIEKSARVDVEIYNLAGQLIISNSFDLQAGAQTLRINLGNLAKGSYILKVTDNNSAHTQQLITKMR